MEACGRRYVSQPWSSFVKHVAIARRKDNLQNLMRKLCLTVVIYANWKEKKNKRCFSNCTYPKELIMSSIIRTCSHK